MWQQHLDRRIGIHKISFNKRKTLTVVHIWLPGVICTSGLDCWQKSCRLASGSTAEVLTETDCCACEKQSCQWNKNGMPDVSGTCQCIRHSIPEDFKLTVRDDTMAICATMQSQHNAINIIIFHLFITLMMPRCFCVWNKRSKGCSLAWSYVFMKHRLQNTFSKWCFQKYQKMWHIEWQNLPTPPSSFCPV